MSSVLETIEDRANSSDLSYTVFDGLDDAIVGTAVDPSLQGSGVLRVIYSEYKIIKVLMDRDRMSFDEASEFFQYNIERLYLGISTPIIMADVYHRVEDEQQGWFTDDEVDDDDEED
jgi:hypothetical protein